MRKRISLFKTLIFILINTIVLTACVRTPVILIGGSSSVAPLMHLLLNGDSYSKDSNNRFEGFNDSFKQRVAYNPSGSSAGETGVTNNTIHMGFTSRDVKDEYLTTTEYSVFSMAIDGMIIIGNLPNSCSIKSPNIKSENISKLKDLYLGKEVSWKDLLGDECNSNATITGINRESGSGTRDTWSTFLNLGNTPFASNLRVASSTSVMINQVKETSNSIGYIAYSAILLAEENNLAVFNINDMIPSINNLRNKTYPLFREFFAIFRNNSQKESQQFIKEFITFISDETRGHKAFQTAHLIFSFRWLNNEPIWIS